MTAETQAQASGNRESRQARRRKHVHPTGIQHMRVALCHNGGVHQNPSPQEISGALKQSGDVVWVDIQGDPTEKMPQLSQTYALPPAIQELILDDVASSRLIESRGVYALVVHGIGFDAQAEEAIVSKLDIVFGQGFMLTLHHQPAEWLDQLWASAQKDGASDGLMGRGVARLLHSVLDTLVDTYFPVIDTLDDLIDQLEDATVNDTSNTVQVRLFRMKRAVATLRRVISPQVELTNSLITRTGALIPAEVEPYFADVRDHTLRVFEMLDSYRDLLSGLLDVYLTTVSNRLNVVMKQLTIIATIFLPITFVTGVFGMNFGHMPQVEHDAGFNFWLVLLGMAVITVAQIWYFRRRGWM